MSLESHSLKGSHDALAAPGPRSNARDDGLYGLPLDEVLLAMAQESDNRKLRRAMEQLAGDLTRGMAFDRAVAGIRHRLPGYFRHALDAAAGPEQTIALLAGLAERDATRRRLQRQLRAVLLYPAIVMALLALVVAGATLFIVPAFEEIFADLGLELPSGTRAVLATSKRLPTILAGLVVIPPAWVFVSMLPGGMRLLHWMRTSVPVLGRVWIWSAHHEFASIMGALTAQRMPISAALDYTAGSLQDRNLARSTAIASRRCEAGVSLSQCLADSIHFDRALTALVNWGETNDALPQALRQATALYEEEIDLHTGFLRRVLPPLMFVIVLTVVFFIVVSLIIPLVDLINNLM